MRRRDLLDHTRRLLGAGLLGRFGCGGLGSMLLGGGGWRGLTTGLGSAALVAPGAARAAAAPPWVVDVEVDLRDEIAAGRFDPARDRVGLRGGWAPLAWDRPLLAEPAGDGRYRLRLVIERAPPGDQPVPHKFRIERDGLGPSEGWEPGPNRLLQLDAPAPRIARRFGEPGPGVVVRRTGTIEPLGRTASRHVAPREVEVWLPPGYHAAGASARHPVLYLHDGQNVFDARAAGAEWQVDEAAQRLCEAGAITPPIIVAVASGPDRLHDYTPTPTWLSARRLGQAEGRRVGGGAPAYARFLAEELKPLVDARFRTRPEPAHTAVGGSSLGGLVSLWLALAQPQVFGSALVVSPSLWWDEGVALRQVQAWAPAPGMPRPRLWLSMGGGEGAEAVPALRQLQQALMARGWDGATLHTVELPEGRHDEASWATLAEPMLRFLYTPRAAG